MHKQNVESQHNNKNQNVSQKKECFFFWATLIWSWVHLDTRLQEALPVDVTHVADLGKWMCTMASILCNPKLSRYKKRGSARSYQSEGMCVREANIMWLTTMQRGLCENSSEKLSLQTELSVRYMTDRLLYPLKVLILWFIAAFLAFMYYHLGLCNERREVCNVT